MSTAVPLHREPYDIPLLSGPIVHHSRAQVISLPRVSGFIIDFVSMPVISGYTSAAALIIASSQLKGLLGLKFEADQFAATVYKTFVNIGKAKLYDSFLGTSCLFILIGTKVSSQCYVNMRSLSPSTYDTLKPSMFRYWKTTTFKGAKWYSIFQQLRMQL